MGKMAWGYFYVEQLVMAQRERVYIRTYGLLHTSVDQFKHQVKLLVRLKELDHMQHIWRLLTLMIDLDLAENLARKLGLMGGVETHNCYTFCRRAPLGPNRLSMILTA